jgi:hypothetical protein
MMLRVLFGIGVFLTLAIPLVIPCRPASAQEGFKGTLSAFDRADWEKWIKAQDGDVFKGLYSAGYLDGFTTGLNVSSSRRQTLLDCS